jgi:hypothetical protein
MSICVDYFFNHSADLATLSRKINGWLGCSLAPYEGNTQDLFSRCLGMELDLSTHSFENDRELNFEDYTYRIGIRSPVPDADLRAIQIPSMALIVHALFYRMNVVGMLVYGMQHLLARYEQRLDLKGSGSEEMFDVVSGEFVTFPEHFFKLHNRLHNVLYLA